MARLKDWIELGKSTFTSLTNDDVTNLYVVEWPETRKMLIAEHRAAIEGDPNRVRRTVRLGSAMLFGLAKKLAPHRRLLFLFAWVFFFVCIFSLATHLKNPPVWTLFQTSVMFVLMTLLLGMELIDKIKFRDELALARDLQASIIPHEMPQHPAYEIAAFNHIANTVGGDIYDFVPLEDGRLAVLFGDASGHGMAAGLVMAVAHAAFRTQLEIDSSPASIIASLNRILCRTGSSRSFFAACYVLLSPDGTYLATIAGHPPILKIDNTGKIVDRIGRGAYPLGIKNANQWSATSGSLEPGERLLLHSDGLTESRNENDREFGDAYVEVICGWHPDATATGLVDSLVSEWRMFTSRLPAEDDVSVAVIRFRSAVT
ncbi:MAG TPA: PP2C family protein-serine/threonine phosphatase [Thermoanaerobaculia bacterium]|nr:PP2C family protein-serine/threonine phosphatase [Thermoanaerobaculia bacterium]